MRSPVIVALLSALVLAAAAHGAGPRGIAGIRSPTGNIRCVFLPVTNGEASRLLCSIAQSSYGAALQRGCVAGPAGVDWHGFELAGARKGAIVCSGGILYDPAAGRPSFATLAYGRTWQHGPFTCASRLTGMTCVGSGGHGLFLSRTSWRAW
jgi:hypothetical protein